MLKNLLIGLLLCLVVGCASGTGQRTSDIVATLTIENESWDDIRVYAVRGGSRVRIATVTSSNTQRVSLKTFQLDNGFLTIEVSPISQGVTYRNSISVLHGSRVLFRYFNQPQFSFLILQE